MNKRQRLFEIKDQIYELQKTIDILMKEHSDIIWDCKYMWDDKYIEKRYHKQ